MSTATGSSLLQREPQLLGQTVVVFGGSAGIGLETARVARDGGAKIVLAARNPEALQRAASELGVQHSAAFDLPTSPNWNASSTTCRLGLITIFSPVPVLTMRRWPSSTLTRGAETWRLFGERRLGKDGRNGDLPAVRR
jgi:hypothetical protein